MSFNYKAAVVGCGNRSRTHINAYNKIDNTEVVACYDPNIARRNEIAAEFSIREYSDAARMIEKEKPEIVHLITPPGTRVELMTLVSELNVPLCIVEKPIAISVDDWRSLCQLEAGTKTKFAISHQVRWQPYLLKCREALECGRLGDVKFLDMSAGMNIAGQGTHTLNYGRYLIGNSKVTLVAGNVYGWDESYTYHPAPAASEAYLTFENGVRGLWTSGWISPRCGDPDMVHKHVRISAYADIGRVNYEEFANWEIVSPEGVENGDFGGMEEWEQNNLIAQTGFHKAMFEWFVDDTKVPGTSLSESLHEWKVVLALYASAVTHKPIEIDEFEPDQKLYQNLTATLKNKKRGKNESCYNNR